MQRPLRLGTRASKLARAQAQMVADKIGVPCEIVAMTTAGDKEMHKTLDHWGHKGLFTKELEDALLEQRIDIAVHSMKDMPSILPDGLAIGALLERADMRDAWVSTKYPTYTSLPKGAVIGTSSARRTAQMLYHNAGARIVPLRGNVETRLRKLQEGAAEATLLACAGLDRLALSEVIRTRIAPEEMLPAVAQGAIGMECRADDADTCALLASLDHVPTNICITAERAMLLALDGSCKTSIGGLALLENDSIFLRGDVLSPDGSIRHYEELHGIASDAARLGKTLGDTLRIRAGDALLRFA